ncbi:peptidase M42, partial [Pseudomonas aeruginosa]
GVAREIARRRDELHGDLYLVLTTMEEESNAGALFAARRLPGDISIAVEVGPTVAEYGTRLCRDPIVNSGDSKGYYSRHITDRLLRAAERCQYQPQAALLVDFASDASALLSHGEAAQVGCIGIPTENTHGFEIVLEEGIETCRRTLVEFLVQPPDDEA